MMYVLLFIWAVYNIWLDNRRVTCILDPKKSITRYDTTSYDIFRGSYNIKKCCADNLCCRNSTIKNIYSYVSKNYVSLVQIC